MREEEREDSKIKEDAQYLVLFVEFFRNWIF